MQATPTFQAPPVLFATDTVPLVKPLSLWFGVSTFVVPAENDCFAYACQAVFVNSLPALARKTQAPVDVVGQLKYAPMSDFDIEPIMLSVHANAVPFMLLATYEPLLKK